jgi:monoamine oxidase
VILAIPPTMMHRIEFTPGLPPLREQLCKRAFMGSTMKVIVIYRKAFWRDAGFSGEAFYLGDINLCPVSICFDNVSADGKMNSLLVFINASQTLRWTAMEKAERKKAVIVQLCKYFGDEAKDVIEYYEKDWGLHPWTRGCPVNLFPPKLLTLCGETLRKPIGKIHFAGTETAMEWQGYMDGAVESGERAATEVLKRLNDKILTDMKEDPYWSRAGTVKRSILSAKVLILVSIFFAILAWYWKTSGK